MNDGNPIDTGEAQYAIDPDIVFNSNNNALCVYRQSDGVNDRIYASRYNGTAWEKWTTNGWGTETAIPIDTGIAQTTNYPSITINSYDNAICTFTHSGRLYANKYNANSLTWILMNGGNPLDTQTGTVSVSDIAFNPENNAITIYTQDDGTNSRLYARWYQGGPKLTSISPASGPNNGITNVTNLAGLNFIIDSVVKLTKSGEADIIATDVNIISENKITCDFDLTNKAIGQWNVVVTAENSLCILSNGFTINDSFIIAENLDSVKVIPNPFKAPKNSKITFSNLTEQSEIKIYTIKGNLIRTINEDGRGQAIWDIRNKNGKKIDSGIYLYLVTDKKGNKKKGRLAIIK